MLGKAKRKIQPWVTPTVLDLCDKRLELRHRKYSSNQAKTQYKQANREVKEEVKAVKEEWIERQCQKIDLGMARGYSKEA